MSHTLEAFRVSTPSNHHTEVGLCQCPAQVQWAGPVLARVRKRTILAGWVNHQVEGGRHQLAAVAAGDTRVGCAGVHLPRSATASVSRRPPKRAHERERERGRWPTSCSQHTRRAPRQLTAVVITPRSTVSTFAAVPSDIPQATSRSDIDIRFSSRFPRSHCMRAGDSLRESLESQAPYLRCHGEGWILTDLHSRRRRGAGRCVVGQGKGRP